MVRVSEPPLRGSARSLLHGRALMLDRARRTARDRAREDRVAIDIQIRADVLAQIVARRAQMLLHAICVAPVEGHYLDHADVVDSELSWAGSQLRVPIEVFVVRRDELTQSAGPSGSHVPSGRATLTFEVAIRTVDDPQQRRTLAALAELRCVDIDFGPLDALLGAAARSFERAVLDEIGTPVSADLTRLVHQLGMGKVSSSSVEQVGGTIVLRLDPSGAAADRIPAGRQWCLFLDATGAEGLAMRFMPESVPGLTRFGAGAMWTPGGAAPVSTDPRVVIAISAHAEVPDPFIAHINARFDCRPSLAGSLPPRLRIDIAWEASVRTGALDALVTLEEIVGLPGMPRPVKEAIRTAVDRAMAPADSEAKRPASIRSRSRSSCPHSMSRSVACTSKRSSATPTVCCSAGVPASASTSGATRS